MGSNRDQNKGKQNWVRYVSAILIAIVLGNVGSYGALRLLFVAMERASGLGPEFIGPALMLLMFFGLDLYAYCGLRRLYPSKLQRTFLFILWATVVPWLGTWFGIYCHCQDELHKFKCEHQYLDGLKK